MFAKLDQETARANAEAKAKADTQALLEEWKKIADRESQRADQLAKADASRIDEAKDLRASVGFMRTSLDEYKLETHDLRSENARLRSARKWYAAGGFAVGAAASYGVCRAFTP